MLKKKKIVFFCLVITILAVLIVIYTKSNPDDSHFFPKCPFKLITGYECPGCGSQRAVHHLLNMKIGSAIQANALLVFSIPYIIILFFAELLESKYRFFKCIYKTLFNPKAIWVIFGIIIFWWIFRNL